MPTKKDLAGLLHETPQQPLRRGRGLRLSRASKQASQPASKSSASPEPAELAPHRSSELDDNAATAVQPNAAEASPAARSKAAKAMPAAEQSEPAVEPADVDVSPSADLPEPERKQRKLLLRKDLLKQCKRIARAQDRKLYQVVEAALEEYIQRYGAHE